MPNVTVVIRHHGRVIAHHFFFQEYATIPLDLQAIAAGLEKKYSEEFVNVGLVILPNGQPDPFYKETRFHDNTLSIHARYGQPTADEAVDEQAFQALLDLVPPKLV